LGDEEDRNGGRALPSSASKQVLPARLQSFDLRVAQKLNLAGNEHTAKARELRSQESNGTPDEETGRSKKTR